MRYGHVTKGVIDQGPRTLPKSWENISGLNNMNPSQLLQLGWLPWELVQVPVGPKQVLNGSKITVESTRIIETQLVRTLSDEEVASGKQQKRDQIKMEVERLLQESNWTQQPDVDNQANPPWLTNKEEFTKYRAQLRAIAINPPASDPVWPVLPEAQWGN